MIHKNSLYIILVLNVVIIYGRLWFDKYFIGYCDKKINHQTIKADQLGSGLNLS